VPGGIGFAEQLYALHEELLAAATALIRDCPCSYGCPACVGAEGVWGEEGKRLALGLLRTMSEEPPA
jgi:DEAD/DEAH box helicase domain-containing protein